jgi:drug/metabolite transporter (DMT)-like permease
MTTPVDVQISRSGLDEGGRERRGRAFVALAALAWSTAGVLQRGLAVSLATQIAGRALFAVIGLTLYIAAAERRRFEHAFRAIGRDGLGMAGLMAVSSGCFITALNYTTVANVLFMQALAPIMAAGLAAVLLHEHVMRRTAAAMTLAVAGVAAMVGTPGGVSAIGESLAFVMGLSFAAAIVLARRGREVSMAPATCISQLLLLLLFGPFSQPGHIGGSDLGLLCLLGFGQMGLGLIFLTIGARLIRAGEVALITLLEVVLGPSWVWLARGERPANGTLVGGGIVLLAVLVQLFPRAAGESALEFPR